MNYFLQHPVIPNGKRVVIASLGSGEKSNN